MKKPLAIILLVVFGNFLASALGTVLLFLMSITPIPPLVWGILSIAVFALHIVCSVFSQIRFKRRYGISEGRYILYGALPSVCLCILSVFASTIWLSNPEYYSDVAVGVFGLSLLSGAYSALYCIILAVILEKREDKETRNSK